MPLWWGNISASVKAIAMMATVAGAITATAAAWPIVAPIVPYPRYTVDEKVEVVAATTREILIWKFEEVKTKATGELQGWVIQLQREKDLQAKVLIQQRIDQIQRDMLETDEKIKKLRGPSGGTMQR